MLPSQVSQYHYHQEIGSATFSGCGFCTYSTFREECPWLPAKLPTVSTKMLHNSVCLLHFLYTVLSVVLHIELPYNIAYCIAYSIHVARFWFVWDEKGGGRGSWVILF